MSIFVLLGEKVTVDQLLVEDYRIAKETPGVAMSILRECHAHKEKDCNGCCMLEQGLAEDL